MYQIKFIYRTYSILWFCWVWIDCRCWGIFVLAYWYRFGRGIWEWLITNLIENRRWFSNGTEHCHAVYYFVLFRSNSLNCFFLFQFAKQQINGLNLRGRRMIVQFTKTKPGRNRRRGHLRRPRRSRRCQTSSRRSSVRRSTRRPAATAGSMRSSSTVTGCSSA